MIVKELNFRYLCSCYVVIQNRGIARLSGGPAEADAFLAGAYIHPEDGLCYLIMDTAVFAPYRRMHTGARTEIRLRDSTVLMNEVMPVRLKRAEMRELDAVFEKTLADLFTVSPVQQVIREDWRLDPWRLRQYPDRFVLPVSKTCEVTVRAEDIDGLVYIGRVLAVSADEGEWKCGDITAFMPAASDKKTDRNDLSIWKLK